MSLIIDYKVLNSKDDVKEVLSKETFKLYEQVSFTEHNYRLGCYKETTNDSMSLTICVGYVQGSKEKNTRVCKHIVYKYNFTQEPCLCVLFKSQPRWRKMSKCF